jgi:hypothetical protein
VSAPPVLIRAEDVEARRAAARAAIRAAGLPAAVTAAAPGTYGLTSGGLRLLEAMESALATGLAAEGALLARVAADRARGFAADEPTDGERRFAGAFGVLVACEEALGATEGGPPAALPDRSFPADDVAAILAAGDGGFAARLVRDLAGYVDHYREHVDTSRRLGDDVRLLACARSHLRRMALAARAAADAVEHAALRDALEAAGVHLPGVEYQGLVRRAADDDEEPELLDVTVDDVVGNRDFLDAGLKLARAVAAFDLAAGKNPRAVDNPVLFALGSPGCGKTVTAHAIGRRFLELCREAGLPGRFRVIRKTDWASHYQNKSAGDLLRIFKDEVFGFHGVCGAYWPDIDTAFQARSGPDVRAEEKANLGTLFGILDGTVGPRNGRWFLLCDANYMDMDEALSSRLTQDPKLVKGPETPADYVQLLRDVKLKHWRDRLPADAEWEPIGRRLKDGGLSGRAVAAIAGRIVAELQDVEEPPGFLKMTYDEKVAALRAAARPVSAPRILEHVETYVHFDRDAAERAHRERFLRRVDEIRLQLSAQALALGAPEGPGGGQA